MRKVIGVSAVVAVYLAGCSMLPGVKQYDPLESGPGRIIQPGGGESSSEAFSELGNKSPYSVNGRFYYVMEDPAHYRARGKASWYGNKHHGKKTSSGETFDMYALTAAHRNLPLPTYLEVTNLDNGKVAIVKVNDRGPFVDDRLIDLSYAAAVKLGMTEKGTAPVEVRAITGPDLIQARKQLERDSVQARQLAGGAKTPTADETTQPVLEVARVDGAAQEVADDTVKSAQEVAAASATVISQTAEPTLAAEAIQTAETVVPAAPAEVAAAPKAVQDSVSDKDLALQLGAFSKLESAAAYMDKAQALVPAIPAFVTEGQSNGKSIFRVRVGPVRSAQLIEEAKAALSAGGIPDHRVLPMQGGGDCVAGCR
ncbi:MAG: septal ring lytic transglycosylase RlpA family protein [Granulosicoccaceae bacterium]